MALEKALSETPINVEVPRAEHHNRLISCQVACPVHTDARGYVRAIAAETQEATDELYHRLFGPGGTMSPREVSYCRFEDPGQVMAQLPTFYQAFSFAPRREESIDHISVEAGFVGYLFLKEASAQMQGDHESGGITKEAKIRFIKERLERCA